MAEQEITTAGDYKKVAELVDNWLEIHQNETFDLDIICRQLEIHQRENRNNVAKKLSYEVNRGNLEKKVRNYRSILSLKEKEYIDWTIASEKDALDIRWPFSHKDNSCFGFDGHVVIRPADLIVVAGQSNKGKSTFARNFLWENMDYFPCQMMVNEYAPGRFKSVVNRMDWRSGVGSNGCPKFQMIVRREDWEYAIEPDCVNIIDWINLSDNFYQIGKIMEDIQKRLRDGICLIVLQKGETATLGRGGQFSLDMASLYMTVDNNVLTVVKAKEPANGRNPNGETYRFDITDGGAQFSGIKRVVKCIRCGGKGVRWEKGSGNTTCSDCEGTGWIAK